MIIQVKRCRTCNCYYYCGDVKIIIKPGDEIDFVEATMKMCSECQQVSSDPRAISNLQNKQNKDTHSF